LIYTLLLLTTGLGASLLANVALFLRLKKSQKEPVPTFEAKELLAQLTRGQAVLQIKVLNPEHLLLRSPRS
jgi:deferrochelatase/peroxidase EfeB